MLRNERQIKTKHYHSFLKQLNVSVHIVISNIITDNN